MSDTSEVRRPTHAAGSSAGYALDLDNPVAIESQRSTGAGAEAAAHTACEPAIQQMIAAIADGNTSAFAVFYEQWFDRGVDLISILTRRDESFCLDVVQDAMVRAIKSLRPRLGIATRQDLDRWMTRVLHTTALDHLRKESRRRTRESRSALGSPAKTPRSGDAPGSHGPSMSPASIKSTSDSATPTDRCELDERIDWVRDRLGEIDSQDRQLVVSHYGHSRTVAAAAASADLTPGAATGRLTRLLARLRTAAKEMFHDES
jgi:RNA polymerase sigma factor (sigma-70 family)